MQDEAILVLCTVPAAGGAAERLARGLVDERLAACVSALSPMRSIYRWQGQVREDSEEQLLIKSVKARLPQIERYLRAHHPYDEPEILALQAAGGSASYLAWIAAQTA